ncbi:hypothetical protein C8Q73DRAFT_186422 [Cubamyces lactineus]|nr:hypothetical protein C8Q73DRAFT_186422 [Cubamyces lactineus]
MLVLLIAPIQGVPYLAPQLFRFSRVLRVRVQSQGIRSISTHASALSGSPAVALGRSDEETRWGKEAGRAGASRGSLGDKRRPCSHFHCALTLLGAGGLYACFELLRTHADSPARTLQGIVPSAHPPSPSSSSPRAVYPSSFWNDAPVSKQRARCPEIAGQDPDLGRRLECCPRRARPGDSLMSTVLYLLTTIRVRKQCVEIGQYVALQILDSGPLYEYSQIRMSTLESDHKPPAIGSNASTIKNPRSSAECSGALSTPLQWSSAPQAPLANRPGKARSESAD